MTKMTKSLENKIKAYNRLVERLNELNYKIEYELDHKYGISSLNRGFRSDEPLDIRECCSECYDVEKIKNIINATIKFYEQTGEMPEYIDLLTILGIKE